MILLPVDDEDLEKLSPILESNNFIKPDTKISVYKNRGGAYKGIYIWCTSNLGICRVSPIFVTTWRHEFVKIDDLKIVVDDEDPPWEV